MRISIEAANKCLFPTQKSHNTNEIYWKDNIVWCCVIIYGCSVPLVIVGHIACLHQKTFSALLVKCQFFISDRNPKSQAENRRREARHRESFKIHPTNCTQLGAASKRLAWAKLNQHWLVYNLYSILDYESINKFYYMLVWNYLNLK